MGLTGGQHGRRTDGVRGHPRSWWVKLGRWPPPPLLLCVAFFLFCLRTYSYNTVFAFVLQVAKQRTLFFFVGLIGAVFVYVFCCTYHTYSYSILIRFAGCEKRFSFFSVGLIGVVLVYVCTSMCFFVVGVIGVVVVYSYCVLWLYWCVVVQVMNRASDGSSIPASWSSCFTGQIDAWSAWSIHSFCCWVGAVSPAWSRDTCILSWICAVQIPHSISLRKAVI